jgi:hypothetical protein
MLKLRLGLYLALSLGLVAGCSSGKNPEAPARVSGVVTYQGKPLPGGMIAFHPAGKAPYSSAIGADGTYEVVDLPAGEMAVTVETESVNPDRKSQTYGGAIGERMKAERLKAEGKAGTMPQQPTGRYRKIPSQYANAKTSPLTLTLEAGRQVKPIELKD